MSHEIQFALGIGLFYVVVLVAWGIAGRLMKSDEHDNGRKHCGHRHA